MSNVKKAYQPLVQFLQDNSDKKVKSILDEVIAMCAPKAGRASGGSNHLFDTDGNPVAILDYYFKRWMPLVGPNLVEFGVKKGTPTGLNTMCKEGVSNWTKQQRDAKNAHTQLLDRVATGEIAPENILDEKAKIEEERQAIVETDLGFETKEEVVAYLLVNGVELKTDAAE